LLSDLPLSLLLLLGEEGVSGEAGPSASFDVASFPGRDVRPFAGLKH
jgi:hypothetical protein